jgi:branched-chain amino acid transport system substrate-binding protein
MSDEKSREERRPNPRRAAPGIARLNRKSLWLTAGLIIVLTALTLLGIRSRSGERGQQPHTEVIRIGAVLPQTGPGAVFAQYIEEGINLAVEEINAGGPPRVRMFYEDSKNQPREGVAAYNKLVSTENPPVVIVALSSVAKALAPLAEQSKTIQVYIAVALPGVTDGKYIFRVYPEASGMAGVMARFNAEHLNAKTSAVVYLNDDFGRTSLEAYQKEFEAQDGRVVFAESYELQQVDFRGLISKLKGVEPAPDVIYLNGYGPSYVAAVKQLREQNVQSQLTADMTMGLPNTLEQAGTAADGVYFVDGKLLPDFSEKFVRRYGREPSSYAGYAYDIVKLLYRTSEGHEAVTADGVREGLLKVKDYEGAMGNIAIQPDGDSNLQFVVKRVTGEQPEPITK